MKSFGQILPKFVKPLAKSRGLAEGELITNWPKITPSLSQYSRPFKLYNGVLTIGVASSSVAQQIEFESIGIISAINTFLGHQAVNKIRCTVQEIKPPQTSEKKQEIPENIKQEAQKRVSFVTDESLRDSLANLIGIYKLKDTNKSEKD